VEFGLLNKTSTNSHGHIEECVVCFILLARWGMYTNQKTN